MSEFFLLDSRVTFSESDDRFRIIQYRLWKSMEAAGSALDQWYRQKGSAETALQGCLRTGEQLMNQHWVAPFLSLLSGFHLGEIDSAQLRRQCVDLTALRETAQAALEILDKADVEYNEGRTVELLRKKSGTLPPGDGTAGVSSDPAAVLTGLDAPDCVVAAEGRELDAETSAKPLVTGYSRRKNLYSHAGGFLRLALENDMRESTNRLIRTVNKQIPGYITCPFSYEKSQTELSGAGAGGDADRAAAVEAFRACPWNRAFYDYAFARFSTQRGKLCELAAAFHIDLGPKVENILAAMFAERPNDAIQTLVSLRKELLQTMQLYSVAESPTLDELECRILDHYTRGLEDADRKTCKSLLRAVKAPEVQEKNRAVYIKRIQDRMHHLVSTNSGETMDEYLLRCNILDPAAVERGIQYVEKHCPAETREQYLLAFRSFNPENILKGRKYFPMSGGGATNAVTRCIGFILMLAGLIFLAAPRWFKLITLLPFAAGLVLQLRIFNWRSVWNAMTLDGEVIHSAFKVDRETFRRMRALAATAKHQKPSAQQGSGSNHVDKGLYD